MSGLGVGSESAAGPTGTAGASGWSAHPDAVDGGTGSRVAPDERSLTASRQVVGLGAICDLRTARADQEHAQSFAVSEFLRLDDARRVILHTDRGFTIGAGGGAALSEGETPASITQDVLNVVLPDDDESGEDHPWSWLAELARDQGFDVTAEDLRELPYEVILTDAVARWLAW